MASDFPFNPDTDILTHESEAPIIDDDDGYYPVPLPEVWSEI